MGWDRFLTKRDSVWDIDEATKRRIEIDKISEEVKERTRKIEINKPLTIEEELFNRGQIKKNRF